MHRIPKNNTELQFIVAGATAGDNGQNSKKKHGMMNSSAPTLIGRPHLPRDHLREGRGAPYRRRHTRELMVMKYEAKMETLPQELMALRAVVEPKFIQASRDVMASEVKTAGKGIFQPGETWGRSSQTRLCRGFGQDVRRTWVKKRYPGRPLSRAKDQSCACC